MIADTWTTTPLVHRENNTNTSEMLSPDSDLSSERKQVVINELGQRRLFFFAFRACGVTQHHLIGIFLTAYNFKPIGSDKLARGSPSRAFVAIEERMKENDAGYVASRRPSYVAPSLIKPKPPRPRSCLFQQPWTAESAPAPVPVNGQIVEFDNDRHRNPDRFATLPGVAQDSCLLCISESLQEFAVFL